MKEKVNLKKKIFNEYAYIVISIILIYFLSSRTDDFALLVVFLGPLFILISFIINPIRILILYKLEFKTIPSNTKKIFYYFITILPILTVICIIFYILICDYIYGK